MPRTSPRRPGGRRRPAPVRVAAVVAGVVSVVIVASGCRAPEDAAPAASPSLADERRRHVTTAATTRPGAVTARSAREHALEVLREWDAARSAALAGQDADAVRSLYEPGSGLAGQDLRLLRRYERRGLRLTEVRHQVLSVDVRVAGARAVELVVVERLAVTRVVLGAAEARMLPASSAIRRVLRFERGGGPEGRWQLSSATEA